jgi:hypothetical protein
MSTPVRVAAFVTALVAVFAAALGLGRLVGPIDTEPVAAHEGEMSGGHGTSDEADAGAEQGGGAEAAAHLPGGLTVSSDGYTLALADTDLPAGDRVPLRFQVVGPDGAPVTAYDVEHEKELHLIVVRRDVAGFQHVHPTRDADGTWSVDVALRPGTWRVLADFTPTGAEGLTLGADVSVAGGFRPAPEPPTRLTDTVDGYTVTLDGTLAPGEASDVTVSVAKDGREVTDLEPYLGAYGHLVALREGDLAYLHVHPEEAGPGPRVPFVAEVPSVGRYRLFFDFQHEGVVRTASFVVATDGAPTPLDHQQEDGESHGH